MWYKLSELEYWFEYIGMTPDPRTHHLLWINVSPLFIIWTSVNFVIFSKVLGPEIMNGLPSFDIRGLMFIYNCLMSLANIYAVYNVVPASGYFHILFNFDYPDRNDMSSRALHLIHMGYLYWLSKILDCWDTCFFVLRKKYAHITLLHVYHHTVVPVFGYILMRINPLLPCVFLFSFVNSTIHVIMYSYYALAALGPWIQPYLWWKKYITIMQLWQFVLYGLYGAAILIFSKDYPPFWLYFGLTQPPLFFWLFYDFYMKAYNIRRGNLVQLLRKWRLRKQREQKHAKSDSDLLGADKSCNNNNIEHNHDYLKNNLNDFKIKHNTKDSNENTDEHQNNVFHSNNKKYYFVKNINTSTITNIRCKK